MSKHTLATDDHLPTLYDTAEAHGFAFGIELAVQKRGGEGRKVVRFFLRAVTDDPTLADEHAFKVEGGDDANHVAVLHKDGWFGVYQVLSGGDV